MQQNIDPFKKTRWYFNVKVDNLPDDTELSKLMNDLSKKYPLHSLCKITEATNLMYVSKKIVSYLETQNQIDQIQLCIFKDYLNETLSLNDNEKKTICWIAIKLSHTIYESFKNTWLPQALKWLLYGIQEQEIAIKKPRQYQFQFQFVNSTVIDEEVKIYSEILQIYPKYNIAMIIQATSQSYIANSIMNLLHGKNCNDIVNIMYFNDIDCNILESMNDKQKKVLLSYVKSGCNQVINDFQYSFMPEVMKILSNNFKYVPDNKPMYYYVQFLDLPLKHYLVSIQKNDIILSNSQNKSWDQKLFDDYIYIFLDKLNMSSYRAELEVAFVDSLSSSQCHFETLGVYSSKCNLDSHSSLWSCKHHKIKLLNTLKNDWDDLLWTLGHELVHFKLHIMGHTSAHKTIPLIHEEGLCQLITLLINIKKNDKNQLEISKTGWTFIETYKKYNWKNYKDLQHNLWNDHNENFQLKYYFSCWSKFDQILKEPQECGTLNGIINYMFKHGSEIPPHLTICNQ